MVKRIMEKSMFSDFQLRRWMTMLDDIASYKNGTFPFGGIVASLEGEFSLGDFTHDLDMQWDKLWFPLEAMYAVELDGGEISQHDKGKMVEECYRFLRLELVKQMISVIDAYQQDSKAIPFSRLADYFKATLGFGKHLVNATEWELWIVTLDAAQYDWSESKNERETTLAKMRNFLVNQFGQVVTTGFGKLNQ